MVQLMYDIRHGVLLLQRFGLILLCLLAFAADAAPNAALSEARTNCLLSEMSAPEAAPNVNTSHSEYRARSYCWALIGNDGTHLAEEAAAGIRSKLFSLSWREYAPSEGTVDLAYVERKRTELAQLWQAGFGVILSLGFHDTPLWVHHNYADTYYVNQFGESYAGQEIDSGDTNLVFNQSLRQLVATYVGDVFADFGADFDAVRLGGGRYGELMYPPAVYGNNRNCYWAFDRNALMQDPVPQWVPGQPSSAGEAQQFLTWYLDSLVEFQNWQIIIVRQSYNGPLMMLYPSWGIRPGDIERAVAVNLDGSTAAEYHGEIPRGIDYTRQITALTDPLVIPTTTWLDADASADDNADPRYWSPVKYLASLAQSHPLGLRLFGENTGHGQVVALRLSALQMRRYGLIGMAWYREEELFTGQYATLDDYRRVIAESNANCLLYLPHITVCATCS